jgi:hypothetical protein
MMGAAPALLLLVACGSTPTQVFDLSPRVPDPLAATDLPHGGLLIWVDKPSVAGLFRPHADGHARGWRQPCLDP